MPVNSYSFAVAVVFNVILYLGASGASVSFLNPAKTICLVFSAFVVVPSFRTFNSNLIVPSAWTASIEVSVISKIWFSRTSFVIFAASSPLIAKICFLILSSRTNLINEDLLSDVTETSDLPSNSIVWRLVESTKSILYVNFDKSSSL